MTSSLVGSEMCIRDRLMPLPGMIYSSTQTVQVISSREKATVKSDRQEAVSYTHLTLPTICSV
eukprot:7056681-Prorocentrum_lima.AAC.1